MDFNKIKAMGLEYAEKAKKWIANGAQPTETVRSLLKKNGIVD